MHRLTSFLVFCAALLVAGPLGANEASDDDNDKPEEITIPPFSMETLAPRQEQMLEGWKLLDKDPGPGDPSEATILPLAKAQGLPEDAVYLEERIVRSPDGKVAPVALVDVDTDPTKFNAALAAKAAEAGWTVRQIATPRRVLVVGGAPEARDVVFEEMIAHMVYEFCAMARTRVNIHSWDKELEKGARNDARGFIKAGRTLVPEAGTLHAIEAIFDFLEHRKQGGKVAGAKAALKKGIRDPEKKAKKEEEQAKAEKAARKAGDAFIAKVRKALTPSVPLPPRGTLEVFAAGQAGGIMLARKDEALLRDAERFLERAEKGKALNFNQEYGVRYNLACAYARGGKIDAAFAMLRKSLELLKLLPWQQYGQSFLHMEKKDDDMKPLRADVRWEPLIKEYRNEKVKRYEENEKKAKERAEKEKRRREGGGDADEGDEDEDGGHGY